MTESTGPDLMAGFDALLGVELVELTADKVVATLAITGKLLQPWGIAHGGVHCAVIETAASVGGAIWYGDKGTVVGVNNSTNFVKAVSAGTVTYTATPIQRGRTQQLWTVEGRLEDGTLVCQGQVRLANLAKRD